ncbi:hypothetical protein EHZ19_31530 [Paraburkholderia bannensis]|nr:hypothetical protein [Paraburkholderia bannensis]RQM43929.1 hypothetical protein EHZ19_31530 [Paraburkholderia bannensis]
MGNRKESPPRSDDLPSTGVELTSIEGLRDYVVSNTRIMSVLCARQAVYQSFLDAVLQKLDVHARASIRNAFRRDVENTMALADELALDDGLAVTPEYHQALLSQANEILRRLA